MTPSTTSQRILVEKRGIILPLVIAVVLNIAVYVLVVYPLGVKSAGAADRAQRAAASLKTAEQDFNAAKALVAGKTRAEEELTTFYGKVLPANQLAAVRLTYLPLTGIAKKANVHLVNRRWQPDIPLKDARLARLKVVAALSGDYEAFRDFIYELETAPEFVIIDQLSITQGEMNKPLSFILELSTYYPLFRPRGNGN